MASSRKLPPAGERNADGPYLALRIDHAFAPAEDADACQAIADLLTRDCLRPLAHLALETVQGKRQRHAGLSAATVVEFLREPSCDALHADSGRQQTLTAMARIVTGRNRALFSAYVAPQVSGLLLPHDPDLLTARLDAFRELAVVLRAVAGCVSLEWDFDLAVAVMGGHSPPPLERMLHYPGMSESRAREREAYQLAFETLDSQLPGPEWGIFLSAEHLRRLSADEMEHGGAFTAVSPLTDDLVYLQLTDDPSDALRHDYDYRLDSARAVLAPIFMDVSDVHVE